MRTTAIEFMHNGKVQARLMLETVNTGEEGMGAVFYEDDNERFCIASRNWLKIQHDHWETFFMEYDIRIPLLKEAREYADFLAEYTEWKPVLCY